MMGSVLGFISAMRRILALLLLSCLAGFAAQEATEPVREELLGRMLALQLQHYHLNSKNRPINDEFSRDVFGLFIKRLDFQKRLLLKKDVQLLEAYRDKIDDEVISGRYTLPDLAWQILNENAKKVEVFCKELLAEEIDFEKPETMESDADKLDYCKDFEELKDRWRRDLKYRVINRYLGFLEREDTNDQVEAEKAKRSGSGNAVTEVQGKAPEATKLEPTRQSEELEMKLHFTPEDDARIDKELDAGKKTEIVTEAELPVLTPSTEVYRVLTPSTNLQMAAGAAPSGNSVAAVPAKPRVRPSDAELLKEARVKEGKNIALFLSRLIDTSREEHYSRYFNAFTAAFDPHTNYLDPEAKEDFNILMKKSLEGIGAVLQETEEGYTKVTKVVPGSASARQGELEAGDIILRVAPNGGEEDVDIANMSVKDVVKYIRGPKGTVVGLTVRKIDNRIKFISIVRDKVVLEDNLTKSTVIEEKTSGKPYGYIWLPDFYRDFQDPSQRSSTADVLREIEKLQKRSIQGMVFDLRNNGGGSLDEARSLSGLFIERGPIVQVKDSGQHIKILYDEDRSIAYTGPLIVLVNQYSASASEIMAAALQDYGRAVIVGTGNSLTGHTHGKGTVQQLIDLDKLAPRQYSHFDYGNLKVTIQKFYRINGLSTQFDGVTPDLLLPDDRSAIEAGERHLEFALPGDRISDAQYHKWKERAIDIGELRAASGRRVEKSEIFQLIQKRDARFLQKKAHTLVSLNIVDIRHELAASQEENREYRRIFGLDEKAAKNNGENEGAGIEDSSEDSQWIKGVIRDPYVQESISILGDMVGGRKS